MTVINNKLFIAHPHGVRILHDASARQFIPTHSFDYAAILGLDKPMRRVKAHTYVWSSSQHCHVVRHPKF